MLLPLCKRAGEVMGIAHPSLTSHALQPALRVYTLQSYDEVMDIINQYYFKPEYSGQYTLATWFYL